MSFIAINKDTNEVVSSLNYSDMRVEYDGWARLIDPITKNPVTPVKRHLRYGEIEVSCHFKVNGGLIDEPSDWEFDPEYAVRCGQGKIRRRESQEHLEGKVYVARKAVEIDKECRAELAHLEYAVITGCGKRRIIDVAFLFRSGMILAHEVQLAKITPQELEARTLDYESLGIDVIWWLGNQAKTQPNIDWYRDFFGEYPPLLEFRVQENTDRLVS